MRSTPRINATPALGTPIAWWLARRRGNLPAAVEALVAMPLILPPTVLGFYLLILFAPDTFVGRFWYWLTGSQLAFSFSALVIGSVIYSLPFVVQPLQAAFERVPQGLLQAAATLGASPGDQFRSIVWPITRRSFLVAGLEPLIFRTPRLRAQACVSQASSLTLALAWAHRTQGEVARWASCSTSLSPPTLSYL